MVETASHYNLRSFVEHFICESDEMEELDSVLGKPHLGLAGWVNHLDDHKPTPEETRRTEIEKDIAPRLADELLTGHWIIEGSREKRKSDFSDFEPIDHRHFQDDFNIDIAGNIISFFNGPVFLKISISMAKARPLVQQMIEIIERVAKGKDPNFFKREDFERAVREELDVHNTPEKFDIAFKTANIHADFHKGGRRKTKNKR